ncbi:CD276 antigen-like isoform X3 [Hemitrygon akajei]|uniref:CD276 antigen-like isoform X3 n=1 Tax=Hemitrygon akajei TaxID=2704970 RepID=UPI003BF9E88E
MVLIGWGAGVLRDCCSQCNFTQSMISVEVPGLNLSFPVVLDSPIVARIGEDSLLICHFNRPWSRELGGIQWSLQRPDGVLLAYIYHQGSVAAQFQDKQFHGRATVNESLLGQGDASLRLQNVTVHDNGTYMCVLHTPEWKKVKEQLLIVTAPYSQPHVNCSPVGGDGAEDEGKVQLDCVSWGGFPLAHLQWVWSNGTEYRSEVQNTSVAQAPDGTYQLRSRLEATTSWDFDLYCVVTDSWLNQSHSSNANCLQHITRGTESTPHSSGHCPHLNDLLKPQQTSECEGVLDTKVTNCNVRQRGGIERVRERWTSLECPDGATESLQC